MVANIKPTLQTSLNQNMSTFTKNVAVALYLIGLSTVAIIISKTNNTTTNNVPTVDASPSPSASPTPSNSNTYTNVDLGLTFRYPKNFFVFEELAIGRIDIQNKNIKLTGVPNFDFRLVEIYFDSRIQPESTAQARANVVKKIISLDTVDVRLYTYPNPNNSEWTVSEAYWESTSHKFSLTMYWNRIDGITPEEGIRQNDQSKLISEIVQSISMAN